MHQGGRIEEERGRQRGCGNDDRQIFRLQGSRGGGRGCGPGARGKRVLKLLPRRKAFQRGEGAGDHRGHITDSAAVNRQVWTEAILPKVVCWAAGVHVHGDCDDVPGSEN